ncbi:hypothetical protein EMPS_06872 [Entomortierella parvispora]|uniref:F-box domain-containing protein n=1 Tax=Entomortierella parvispora TaxID=205924 RepID=A0A9P3LXU3_9FUNG|nr:hypothetical protein EMPS_06872 [Entomortierella parvispora]
MHPMTHQSNDLNISESLVDSDVVATPTAQATPTLVPSEPPLRLLELPIEVLMELALYLDFRSFARLIQTCSSLHDSLDTHYIWHRLFLIRFGQSFLATKLKELELVPESPPASPTTPTTPISPTHSSSKSGSSNQSSTSSSPFVEDGYLSSNVSEDDSGNHDVEEGGDKADPKGKGKKFDIRKTNAASKELLISLFKEWKRMVIPAEFMSIVHMHTRYWELVENSTSTFGKLAKLNSVWWMDIEAIFRGVPPGRYKVQWRLGLTSEAPVVNTEFRVVLFDQNEDDTTGFDAKLNAIQFRPRGIQEFTEQTDSLIANTNRQPFKRLFKGLLTMELPGELIIKQRHSGVFVQIRNHEGWKSGLTVDYVRLVNLDDTEHSKELLINRLIDRTAVDEVPNDGGEEYYPSRASSWFQSKGINSNTMSINSYTRRSRAVRNFQPIADPSILEVGARSPTTSGTSNLEPTSAAPNQQQPNDGRTDGNSRRTSNNNGNNGNGGNGPAMQDEPECDIL